VREALRSREGRPLERRTRTRHRQHEAQAGQRGKQAPTPKHGGRRAARGLGAGLTVGPGRVVRPDGIDRERFEKSGCHQVLLG
jgi:hypothetical protein